MTRKRVILLAGSLVGVLLLAGGGIAAYLLLMPPGNHAADTGESHQKAEAHPEAEQHAEAQHAEVKHAEGQHQEDPHQEDQHHEVQHKTEEGHTAEEKAETMPEVKQPGPMVPRLRSDIRALFALQDAAAAGNAQSPAVQRAMLSQTSIQLAQADEADLAFLTLDIAAMVLSGAHPKLAEHAAKLPHLDSRTRNLLSGAAHFMRGESAEALAAWKTIELSQFPQHISGRLALARAILAKEDATEMQMWLEQAIALMPGTLVEESALRRSAENYGGKHDQAGLWRRAERYMRRFPHSLYGADFTQEIVAQLVEIEAKTKLLDRDRLDRFLNLTPLAQRRQGYLLMSRLAAAAKLVDLTDHAARRLERLAVPGSVEDRIAVLYRFMFDLGTDQWREARARLAAIAPDGLPETESALLAASLAIANGLAAPPPAAGSDMAADETPAESPPPAKERADMALAAADKILAEVQ